MGVSQNMFYVKRNESRFNYPVLASLVRHSFYFAPFSIAVLSSASADEHTRFPLSPHVSSSYIYHSNLFRFQNAQEAKRVRGNTKLDDSSVLLSAGATLQKKYRRQELFADFTFFNQRYYDSDFLNYNGNKAQLDFHWEAYSNWSGSVGYTQHKTLTDTSELQLTSRDILTQQSWQANTAYAHRWSLHSQFRASMLRVRHDLTARKIYNYDAQIFSYQIVHRTRKLSSLSAGFNLKTISLTDAPETTEYVEQAITGSAHWVATPKNRLTITAGWLSQQGQKIQSYNEPTIRLKSAYSPTTKILLSSEIWRTVSDVADQIPVPAQEIGIDLRSIYELSYKIRLAASAKIQDKSYLENSEDSANNGREDQIISMTFDLNYQLLRKINALLSITNYRQSSTTNGISYNATTAKLTLNGHY